MSLSDAYNTRRITPIADAAAQPQLSIKLLIPGDRDTIEIEYADKAPPHIDTATLLLSRAEARRLHQELGEFLKKSS